MIESSLSSENLKHRVSYTQKTIDKNFEAIENKNYSLFFEMLMRDR